MKWKMIILAMVVVSGCTTQKKINLAHKYIEQHPVILEEYVDTIVRIEIDSVIRVDTFNQVFNVFIPADTVFIETEVKHVKDSSNLDEWGSPWHTETDTVSASLGFSEAISYVKDGTLHLELTQREDTLRIPYDSVVVQKNYWKDVYYQELLRIETKEPVPWYHIATTWILAGEIVILILLLIISQILKRLKR